MREDNVGDFVAYLRQADVRLAVEGEALTVNAPRGALTPELRVHIGERKQELVAFLRQAPPLPSIVPDPARRYEPFPLNDIQLSYWMGRDSTFELGNVATHVYFELACTDLDVHRLQAAWRQLIDRHDALRTIVMPDGRQRVLKDVPPYVIEVEELRGADHDTIHSRQDAVRHQLSHQVVPADRWPLFDIRVTRINAQRAHLHISLDALMADAWSMVRLFQEWASLYTHPGAVLPPLPISFRDLTLGELALQETDLYKQSLHYWRERLDELPPAPALPLARHASTLAKPQFTRFDGQLPVETWQALKQRAHHEGLTPSGLLLAAYAEVLGTWSTNPRFTINMTLFQRLALHPQVNDIVGNSTSMVLVAVDQTRAASFRDRAAQLQQQLWADLDHRYVSGVQVLRDLARRQPGGQRALMPVVFTSTLGLGAWRTEDSGLQVFGALVHAISQTPQVWLDHQVNERDSGLAFNWDVVVDVFPDGMIDDMFEAYRRLLQRLATVASAWTAPWRDLVPARQLAVRAEANRTEAPLTEVLLHGLFETQARTATVRPAVIAPDRTLTYQELLILSRRLGWRLRRLGVQPHTLVAVVMEKGWEQVVSVLGILMAGAAYLPIDPGLPQRRRQTLLAAGEVTVALAQSRCNADEQWPTGVHRLCLDIDDLRAERDAPLPPVHTAADLAYVFYTSGSTGMPKGVMLDHRGPVNTVTDINRRYAVAPGDRVIALSALHFDLSVYDLFGTLSAGAALVMPAPSGVKDPAHWVALMERHGITVWNSVPTLMLMLVEYLEKHPEHRPPTLRLVLLSGDWIPLSLPDRIKALFPDVQVISAGGPTETSVWNIHYPIDRIDPAWKSIPYGKPLTNQQYHVLNDRLEPCPDWVPGVLYAAGTGLAQGYWRDPEKTSAAFLTHPRTGVRLYRTGDLGRYLPDGNLEILGREDFQVKINGYRVELGEIDAMLEKHPRVKRAVATTCSGQGGPQLVAYVVAAPDEAAPAPSRGLPGLSLEQVAAGADADVLLDPAARLAFKLRQPALRLCTPATTDVRLMQPAADAVLRRAYLHRQSVREYLQAPVPYEDFSLFLACLAQLRLEGIALPKYRYPSGGGLYPVQTYLYIKPGRVAGIDAGVYYYHPADHRLVLITAGPALAELRHDAVNRAAGEQSAFALFLVGEMRAIQPMYAHMALPYAMLEAGYMGQLLMTEAPRYGIGLCPIGELEFEPHRNTLALSASQLLLHSFVGGAMAPARLQQWLQPAAPAAGDALATELRQYLSEHLPEYMVPTAIVELAELPLSPNGKINRQALPAPDRGAWPQRTTYVAPRTPLEEDLAQIWSEVLGVERVGVHDDFFAVGGDSLLATRILGTLSDSFEVELPLRTFLDNPTIAGVAQAVDVLRWTSSAAPADATVSAGEEEVEF